MIEELLGAAIVDETDRFVDRAHTTRADPARLARTLPPRLQRILARGMLKPRVGPHGERTLPGGGRGGGGRGGGPRAPATSGGGAGEGLTTPLLRAAAEGDGAA